MNWKTAIYVTNFDKQLLCVQPQIIAWCLISIGLRKNIPCLHMHVAGAQISVHYMNMLYYYSINALIKKFNFENSIHSCCIVRSISLCVSKSWIKSSIDDMIQHCGSCHSLIYVLMTAYWQFMNNYNLNDHLSAMHHDQCISSIPCITCRHFSLEEHAWK